MQNSCFLPVAIIVALSNAVLLPTIVTAQTIDGTLRERLSGNSIFNPEWRPGVVKPMTASEESNIREQRLPRGAVMGDGLGPLHNATSCAACHVAGGGSGVEHNVTLITIDPRSEALKKPPLEERDFINLFPGVIDSRGFLIFDTVVHDRSTRSGYEEIRNRLADFIPNGLEDSWFQPAHRTSASIAKRPVIAGRCGEVDFYLSQRNSPPLFGIGAIDSIKQYRLVALAEKQAKASNGKITGRVAGKFGWRGQVATLQEFVFSACAGELGLSSLARSQADDPADPNYFNAGQDLDAMEVIQLVGYVGSIPRPIERSDNSHSASDVIQGEKIFSAIGCGTCHVADVRPVSGLFSDLLLHDMGQQLQAPSPAPIGTMTNVPTMTQMLVFTNGSPASKNSSRSGSSVGGYYGAPSQSLPRPYSMTTASEPRFPQADLPVTDELKHTALDKTWDAMQREWRTPPLWGVKDTAPYLHDGRATTLEEAIMWHGGEGESSRVGFAELTQSDKAFVLAFLSSLRAPEMTQ